MITKYKVRKKYKKPGTKLQEPNLSAGVGKFQIMNFKSEASSSKSGEKNQITKTKNKILKSEYLNSKSGGIQR